MCICVSESAIACKATRYGYSVNEFMGEPCKCVCHTDLEYHEHMDADDPEEDLDPQWKTPEEWIDEEL